MTATSATHVTAAHSASFADPARSWLAMIPLAGLSLWLIQPQMATTGARAGLTAFAMAGLALGAVREPDGAPSFQRLITLIAPVQFALLAWLSFSVAPGLFGAFLLAGLAAAELAVTTVLLAFAEIAAGTSGASAALLIASKYAGFAGRLS